MQDLSRSSRAMAALRHGLLFVAITVSFLLTRALPTQTPTPVTVPTWRYDLTHSGQNTNETALTPANVNSASFGKLFSHTVDGSVYPQPLYVPGLAMGDGLVHNVLLGATEHDSISAFDADSNGGANANPLWHITLLDAAYGAGAGGGTYTDGQLVTLSDTDRNASIYYTTDGSQPTFASSLYSGPIAAAASETIRAIAIDPNRQNSNVLVTAYVIQSAGTSINFGSGFSSVAGLTLNGSTINSDDIRLQLTDGKYHEARSVFWNQPIGIQAFTTDFSFRLSQALADGFTFTLQNEGATAIGPSGSGLGYGASKPGSAGGVGKSVAIKLDVYSNLGEGTDSTGVYTDGASPTTPALDMMSSGVLLRSGHIFHAHIAYDGTNLTMVLTDTATGASFREQQAVNIPSIVGSSSAYAGFTGGTGGSSMTTDILNWTFSQ